MFIYLEKIVNENDNTKIKFIFLEIIIRQQHGDNNTFKILHNIDF